MTNDTLEKNPATPELIRAELSLALSKEGLAYQTLLQQGEDIKLTRDNLETERPKLDELEKVEKSLEKMVNPWTARWKSWNESRKSLLDPVSVLVAKNKADLTKIANELAAEKKKADDAAAREKGIKDAIDTFFIDQSQAIANAKDTGTLVLIEKIIGSAKANKSRYAEFLPDLVIKADLLTPLIKKQKEALRELDGLKSAENAANEIGDDQAVLDSREAQEQIQAKIEEAKTTVQEKAIGMATHSTTVTLSAILPEISAKRRTWDWEIKDVAALYKKAPHLVELTADKEKIKDILKNKMTEGETKNVTEISYLNGLIRFFVKTTY